MSYEREFRITESGDQRITENGDLRITSSFGFDLDPLASLSSIFVLATIDVGCVTEIGTLTVSYDSTYDVSGGVSPYTFVITDGALPTGLSLDASTGEITGTPTVIGMKTFKVRVTDNVGNFSDQICTITISSVPSAKSGIYQVKVGQTHDELYDDLTDPFNPTTVNVKIPNPFFETYLVGDE